MARKTRKTNNLTVSITAKYSNTGNLYLIARSNTGREIASIDITHGSVDKTYWLLYTVHAPAVVNDDTLTLVIDPSLYRTIDSMPHTTTEIARVERACEYMKKIAVQLIAVNEVLTPAQYALLIESRKIESKNRKLASMTRIDRKRAAYQIHWASRSRSTMVA